MLDADELNENGVPADAVSLGFPVEGLDDQTIVGTAEWAKQFQNPPGDDLLLESFLYYWEHDAFLPEPGAPAPPSPEESRARTDREFYLSLGAERSDRPCRNNECKRGAVAQSVFCRIHHFEMIERRRCPFED